MAGARSYMLSLNPKVLRWARRRTRMDVADLAAKVGVSPDKVAEWEETGSLTRKEADQLATATRTAYGYLLMSTTPEDMLPIADYRTVGSTRVEEPSPELFDTLLAMTGRQEWAHEERVAAGKKPLAFAGCRSIATASPEAVAQDMRSALDLDAEWQEGLNQAAARRLMVERMDLAGIVVCINGIVGNNTHRPLDLQEFRGFAIADSYAPVVFVNGKDALAGQIFTLAHEFAHVIVGLGGVSSWDYESARPGIEAFCNKAAAEFLVPQTSLRRLRDNCTKEDDIVQAASKMFCVSPIVVVYRLKELRLISASSFRILRSRHAASAERQNLSGRGKSGGNFWNTQSYRLGPKFGQEVVRAVESGRLPYREAWELTGLNGNAFDLFASKSSALQL